MIMNIITTTITKSAITSIITTTMKNMIMSITITTMKNMIMSITITTMKSATMSIIITTIMKSVTMSIIITTIMKSMSTIIMMESAAAAVDTIITTIMRVIIMQMRYSQAGVKRQFILIQRMRYGNVLRAKGMVAGADGEWIYFDMVPEEHEVRTGAPEYTGRICVIGAELNEDKLAELFKLK